jgi:hypothetical protein
MIHGLGFVARPLFFWRAPQSPLKPDALTTGAQRSAAHAARAHLDRLRASRGVAGIGPTSAIDVSRQ